MIKLRKSEDRGHFNHGWLESYHTFSFAEYRNSAFMNYRSLRVINEDWIEAGKGFGTHFHRDMEIISYVLAGSLEHKDSMGNGSIIKPGDVQYMSAGSGVEHSEYNPSTTEKGHFLQIWIMPNEMAAEPRYKQIALSHSDREGKLKLAASPDGRAGSIAIRQNAESYISTLGAEKRIDFSANAAQFYWVQVASGFLQINDTTLHTGDGAAIEGESALHFLGKAPSSEFLRLALN